MLNTAYEFEPLEDLDEQEKFLSILYHDSRNGYAIRMLLGEDKDTPYVRHYASRKFEDIEYRSSEYNAYCTVNTFKSFRRVSEEVYNFSGIFIDLDGHNYKSVKSMDKAIENTKERLKKAFRDKEVSVPTMICHSGRGLGIYYVLKKSIANQPNAAKSIKYLDEVRAALTAKYKHILSGRGYLDVDTTVKDSARVCRMPLTYNHKADRWCRLIHVAYDQNGEVRYYDLKEIAKESHLFDEINEIKRQIASKKVVSLDAYKLPFLTIRLQKLEILQELRKYDCHGCREYMIFIYYNSAKQIYGDKAGMEATRAFNKRFNLPLDDTELANAFDGINRNIPQTKDYEGYYKLPDSWVIENLGVSEEENKMCKFGSSKRQIERQQMKENNARRKQERNSAIVKQICEHPDMTYADIALQYGVSEKTVQRIAADNEVSRHKKQQDFTDRNAVETTVADTEKTTGQNLAKSSLGVFLAVETGDGDGLIEAYVSLYQSVTSRRTKQKQIPGQLAFRFNSSGTVEYYMIS